MSNGVGIPPDIAARMEQQTPRGIGGGAPENLKTSTQRGAAMGVSQPLEKEDEPAVEKEEQKEEFCPNKSCGKTVESDWNACPKCKTDLLSGSPSKKLGVKYSEKDLTDYLFKGYIIREVTVLGKHKMTLKSSQPKDLEDIDNYIMNGKWAKGTDGEDRAISDFYMRQVNSMCMTGAALVAFDGNPIGETIEDRVNWLKERGGGFVDILSQRVVLFSQSIAEFLSSEDTVLGS